GQRERVDSEEGGDPAQARLVAEAVHLDPGALRSVAEAGERIHLGHVALLDPIGPVLDHVDLARAPALGQHQLAGPGTRGRAAPAEHEPLHHRDLRAGYSPSTTNVMRVFRSRSAGSVLWGRVEPRPTAWSRSAATPRSTRRRLTSSARATVSCW